MSKHTLSISINAAEKKYILRDLEDAIDGRICEQLGLPHDVGLDAKTAKLVKAAAAKMYEPYIKRVVKHIADDIEVSSDSIDLVWDLAPYATAADRISNRLDVRSRSATACEDKDLNRLQRMADNMGYKLVRDDE